MPAASPFAPPIANNGEEEEEDLEVGGIKKL
jgi:hypothetical protein